MDNVPGKLNYLCTPFKNKKANRSGNYTDLSSKGSSDGGPSLETSVLLPIFGNFVLLGFFFPRRSTLPAPHSTSISLLSIFSFDLCSGLRNNFLRTLGSHLDERQPNI